jgi:hypothetical protein
MRQETDRCCPRLVPHVQDRRQALQRKPPRRARIPNAEVAQDGAAIDGHAPGKPHARQLQLMEMRSEAASKRRRQGHVRAGRTPPTAVTEDEIKGRYGCVEQYCYSVRKGDFCLDVDMPQAIPSHHGLPPLSPRSACPRLKTRT